MAPPAGYSLVGSVSIQYLDPSENRVRTATPQVYISDALREIKPAGNLPPQYNKAYYRDFYAEVNELHGQNISVQVRHRWYDAGDVLSGKEQSEVFTITIPAGKPSNTRANREYNKTLVFVKLYQHRYEIASQDVVVDDVPNVNEAGSTPLYLHNFHSAIYPDGIQSNTGKQWQECRIEIYSKTTVTQTTRIDEQGMGRVPIEIKSQINTKGETSQTNVSSRIWATSARVNFFALQEGQYRDLFSKNNGDFILHYYEDDILKFRGFSVSDLYRESYTSSKYPVELYFTDGVTVMKDRPFVMQKLEGFRERPYEIVKEILQRLGDTLTLYENCNRYPLSSTPSPTLSPLRVQLVDLRNFVGLTEYEVMEQIAILCGGYWRKSYDLQNRQESAWYLIDFNEYAVSRRFRKHNLENDTIATVDMPAPLPITHIDPQGNPKRGGESRMTYTLDNAAMRESLFAVPIVKIVKDLKLIPEFIEDGQFGENAFDYDGSFRDDRDRSRNRDVINSVPRPTHILKNWAVGGDLKYGSETDEYFSGTYKIQINHHHMTVGGNDFFADRAIVEYQEYHEATNMNPTRAEPSLSAFTQFITDSGYIQDGGYLSYMYAYYGKQYQYYIESNTFNVLPGEFSLLRFSLTLGAKLLQSESVNTTYNPTKLAKPAVFVVSVLFRAQGDDQDQYLTGGLGISNTPYYFYFPINGTISTGGNFINRYDLPDLSFTQEGEVRVRIHPLLQGIGEVDGEWPAYLDFTYIHAVETEYRTIDNLTITKEEIYASTEAGQEQFKNAQEIVVRFTDQAGDLSVSSLQDLNGEPIDGYKDRFGTTLGRLHEAIASQALAWLDVKKLRLLDFRTEDETAGFSPHIPVHLTQFPTEQYIITSYTYHPKDDYGHRAVLFEAEQLFFEKKQTFFSTPTQQSSGKPLSSTGSGLGDGNTISPIINNNNYATEGDGVPPTLQLVTESGNTTSLEIVAKSFRAGVLSMLDAVLRSTTGLSIQSAQAMLITTTTQSVKIQNSLEIYPDGRVRIANRTASPNTLAAFDPNGNVGYLFLGNALSIEDGRLEVDIPTTQDRYIVDTEWDEFYRWFRYERNDGHTFNGGQIPVASSSRFGLIKVGNGLTINNGILATSGSGASNWYVTNFYYDAVARRIHLNQNGSAQDFDPILPYASSGVAGLIKIGSGLTINGSGVVSVSGSGSGGSGQVTGINFTGPQLRLDQTSGGTKYASIPYATPNSYGVVRVGTGLSVNNGVIYLSSGSGGGGNNPYPTGVDFNPSNRQLVISLSNGNSVSTPIEAATQSGYGVVRLSDLPSGGGSSSAIQGALENPNGNTYSIGSGWTTIHSLASQSNTGLAIFAVSILPQQTNDWEVEVRCRIGSTNTYEERFSYAVRGLTQFTFSGCQRYTTGSDVVIEMRKVGGSGSTTSMRREFANITVIR